MSDETTLLPCPFCGGEALLLGDYAHGYIVECHDCSARTASYGSENEAGAIAAWNTRATLGRPTFDANLEQALSFMRIWISEDAHLGESAISCKLEKAEGLRKLDAIESAIAAELGSEPPSTVYIVESYDSLTEGGYVEPTCYTGKQAAIRRAESQTYDDGDGVQYWAHWKELKVVE